MSLQPDDAAGPRESELDQLVLRCLSRIESDGERALEVECERTPELADALRRRIRLLREAGLVGASTGKDFPAQLGDFRLLRHIGGGGMGVVYLAEQSALQRRVALKLIRPEHLYFPGARARFVREAQAIARLAHPGIVPVHTFGEANGIPYLAMEFVEGASLASLLALLGPRDPAQLRGSDLLEALCTRAELQPQPSDRAAMPYAGSWFDACAWIAREIAQALEHAHQRGVVHRDVKPSNVMLTPSGRVMLVDFGLASTAGANELTQTGTQIGSLPYMAPERIEGRADASGPHADVYGLGVTLYEALALRRPFDDPDASHLRAAIVAGSSPRLSELVPTLPRDLQAVAEIAMSPDIATRYGAAADVARDLSHVLAREPIEARPAGALTRARRWAARNPARALAAALTLLIVVGGPLGFGVVQKRAAARERDLNRELGDAKQDVDRSNARLLASNAELERKRVDLTAALARESDERQRAQANFGHALDAVDTLLTRVGAEQLEWVPQMEGLRRDLLEDALAFYGRFLEDSGDDPRVRLRAAATQRKVSSIREELGQLELARESGAAAVATMRELARARPDDEEVRRELLAALVQYSDTLVPLQKFEEGEAVHRELIERFESAIAAASSPPAYERTQLTTTQQQLAFLLRDTGRTDEAIEYARRAAEGLRALAAEAPEDLDLQHRLGVALLSWANLGSYASPLKQSEERLLDAIAVLRAARARDPDYPPIRESLASGLGTLGWILSGPEIERHYPSAGPSAEEALREAIEINRALIAEFPLRTLYQINVASESGNLCVHLLRTRRVEEARPFAESAVEAYETLVRLEPQVADHHAHLGATLCNLAMLDIQQGAAASALPLIDRAILEHRAAVAAEPRNAEFTGNIRQWHVCRVLALLPLGRWRDAQGQLNEFEDAYDDEAARMWAAERRLECVELAATDASLSEAERARAADVLRAETVERLRQLVENGLDPTKLAQRDAFASLREHAGFRELVDARGND